MVAYVFPPLGGGGVHRTLGFARHLLGHGWRSTVLCAREDSTYWARDASLVKQVPDAVRVEPVAEGRAELAYRATRRLMPGRLGRAYQRTVLVPDRQVTWLAPALARGRQILAEGRTQAVYSTGGPWTDHLVGLGLKRRFGLPWVADFRDPWTQSELFAPASPMHRRLCERLEQAVLREADHVVVNTPVQLDRLLEACPEVRGKASCITNGFDEQDFEGLLRPPRDDGKLVIAYAGSLYPGRDGGAFFGLLERWLAAGGPHAERLQLRLYGMVEDAAGRLPPRLRAQAQVQGYLPQHEAFSALAAADAVLMTMPDSQGPVGFIPGKLFPLLRLGKPILAPCGPGPAADLLRDSGLSTCVFDPRAPDAGSILATWLEELAQGRLRDRPHGAEGAARYERRALTAQLAEVLDRVAAKSGASKPTVPRQLHLR